jgi:Tfp pilus assembly protein PilN
MYEMIDVLMQWLVAPIIVVVWFLFNKVNKNETDIAVIKAQQASNREAHDREMKEMKETIKAIFNKLDTIEQALRNR